MAQTAQAAQLRRNALVDGVLNEPTTPERASNRGASRSTPPSCRVVPEEMASLTTAPPMSASVSKAQQRDWSSWLIHPWGSRISFERGAPEHRNTRYAASLIADSHHVIMTALFDFRNDIAEVVQGSIMEARTALGKDIHQSVNGAFSSFEGSFKASFAKELSEMRGEIADLKKEVVEWKLALKHDREEWKKEVSEWNEAVKKEVGEWKQTSRREVGEWKEEVQKEARATNDTIKDFRKDIKEGREFAEESYKAFNQLRVSLKPLKDTVDDLELLRSRTAHLCTSILQVEKACTDVSTIKDSVKTAWQSYEKFNREIEKLNSVVEGAWKTRDSIKQEMDDQMAAAREAKRALENVKDRGQDIESCINRIKELSSKFESMNSKLVGVDLDKAADKFADAAAKAEKLKKAMDKSDNVEDEFRDMSERWKKLGRDVRSAAERMEECNQAGTVSSFKQTVESLAKQMRACQDVVFQTSEQMTAELDKWKVELEHSTREKLHTGMDEFQREMGKRRNNFVNASVEQEGSFRTTSTYLEEVKRDMGNIEGKVKSITDLANKEFEKLKREVDDMNSLQITQTIQGIERSVTNSFRSLLGGFFTTLAAIVASAIAANDN